VQYKSQLKRMKELLEKAQAARGGEDVGLPKSLSLFHLFYFFFPLPFFCSKTQQTQHCVCVCPEGRGWGVGGGVRASVRVCVCLVLSLERQCPNTITREWQYREYFFRMRELAHEHQLLMSKGTTESTFSVFRMHELAYEHQLPCIGTNK